MKEKGASQVALVLKNPPASAGDRRNSGSIPDRKVRKMPWRRAWQPTPVFLPRECHGQRSLVGYSLCGCKESDTTARRHIRSNQDSVSSNLHHHWNTNVKISL